ncbi:hypothetical protein MSAN_00480800 [Mycena sanguinolenta]|uniref:Uncharacterized protein n=1 Tax=Mycena sanguinolenta TaxID=230812 RepID=A0A8H6Z8A7_9AGAR|nr:hypothetical protein MSAN_00480800 [Mycena sanguinolenta]
MYHTADLESFLRTLRFLFNHQFQSLSASYLHSSSLLPRAFGQFLTRVRRHPFDLSDSSFRLAEWRTGADSPPTAFPSLSSLQRLPRIFAFYSLPDAVHDPVPARRAFTGFVLVLVSVILNTTSTSFPDPSLSSKAPNNAGDSERRLRIPTQCAALAVTGGNINDTTIVYVYFVFT